MASHNDFGKIAEDFAVEHLQRNGYKILARNYRFQRAEIDIISEIKNLIVVIEVKARSTDAFMLPQEAVTKTKIRSIVNAADHYLEEFNHVKEVRFDIISVLPDEKGKLVLEHIEDAFQAFDAN
ncbi:YraN family protein [Chryseobacterium sp. PTM-20240506]|jgi:putative endonuclease|uniref:YraN family protein n=1 Tax=unclassified Chryseobacterium TaxID=2593645 RepID=UPI002358F790|nr:MULTISPECIES: YraN family protein [unclassified Chryseobacterium]MDC8105999.1 YraN family protein [Chryseobacterium sp. B21-037]MDQ1804503.1 YraN family protein [Chryseobacterium sp. CKR4-1]WBV55210.1 YraN family protein [Chryseobacterium daecheongense]